MVAEPTPKCRSEYPHHRGQPSACIWCRRMKYAGLFPWTPLLTWAIFPLIALKLFSPVFIRTSEAAIYRKNKGAVQIQAEVT